MTKSYDAIVIGTGQSGPGLAKRMAGAGLRVAIIERERFGGTCVNWGCIPTKTLIASARAAHVARRAADFGVSIDGAVRVDMKRVKARKDEIVRPSTEGVESSLRDTEHCEVFRGHARFEDAHTLAVNGERLVGDRIFVNVGARALVPEIPGLDEIEFLTNSEMLDVDFLPEHLIVVGGGYVGLEFAQMYRRFGSRVTLIQKAPRLAPREDEDVSDAIREFLEEEGIDVRLGASVGRFRKQGSGVVATIEGGGRGKEIEGTHVLLAIGRRPNTDDLGLEKAGVATDSRGFIEVDDELRTSVAHIWATGDCNGRGAFTHTSYNDYEIVAANLLDGDSRRVTDRITAYAIYTDPPLGRAGMTEKEVRQSGRKALMATMPMESVGRARERSETRGFMKVLVDAGTRRILGASILGIEGDEVIHCILDVMYAGAPYTTIQRAVHIHPTVSELLPTLLDSLEPLE